MTYDALYIDQTDICGEPCAVTININMFTVGKDTRTITTAYIHPVAMPYRLYVGTSVCCPKDEAHLNGDGQRYALARAIEQMHDYEEYHQKIAELPKVFKLATYEFDGFEDHLYRVEAAAILNPKVEMVTT